MAKETHSFTLPIRKSKKKEELPNNRIELLTFA